MHDFILTNGCKQNPTKHHLESLVELLLLPLYRVDDIVEPLLFCLVREFGIGSAAVALVDGVSEVLGNNPLGAVDSAFGKAIFHLCELDLGSSRLLLVAVNVLVVNIDAVLNPHS